MQHRFRKMREEDFEDLYRLLSNPQVMRYIEPVYSRKKTEEFLSEAGICEDPLIYAVEDENKCFLGYVIYHDYDEFSKEIGWILFPEYWNQGIAGELTGELIRKAEKENKDVVLECAKEQSISRHIATKYGFELWKENADLLVYRRRTLLFREAELSEELTEELISMSVAWEKENSTYGYRRNTLEDIRGNRIFIAKKGDAILAYLFGNVYTSKNMKSIMEEGSVCFEVEELYVKPEYRSIGIGRRLFQYAEECVKEEADYITLSTATKNYKAILHFYLDELELEFWSARLYKKI